MFGGAGIVRGNLKRRDVNQKIKDKVAKVETFTGEIGKRRRSICLKSISIGRPVSTSHHPSFKG